MSRKVGVLGTGMVGNAIGSRLIELGYEVRMGSRSDANEKAIAWASKHGKAASQGTFTSASEFGEMIFNCLKGEIAPEVLKSIPQELLASKTIVDISNPLDFSGGMPPTLISRYANTYSLAEELQRLLPQSHIVKTLNMVNCLVMIDASKSGGDATMFMCGNSSDAKNTVRGILEQFGWKDILDLGDITAARGIEMLLPVWLSIWQSTGNGYFAFKIVRS